MLIKKNLFAIIMLPEINRYLLRSRHWWSLTKYLLYLLHLITIVFTSHCYPNNMKEKMYHFEDIIMGVQFELKLKATSYQYASKLAHISFTRIRQLDNTLSNYRENSYLHRVEKLSMKKMIKIKKDLTKLINIGINLYHETHGVFDFTQGKYISKNKKHPGSWLKKKKAILPQSLITALHFSYSESMVKTDTKIEFDFGAFGKGYACDEVLKILRKAKITKAMVNASGDICVIGSWNISILDAEKYIKTHIKSTLLQIRLKNSSIATSGNYFQKHDSSGHGHIVNLKNTNSVVNLSVSVIGKNATLTDAYATYLSVINAKEATHFINFNNKNFASLIISSNYDYFPSKRFKQYVIKSR